ncbi:hypothetical protein BVX98_00080 [bacterium F11]|nr:hypothetical protein BVX98_00080 [bacterium F11]
MAQIRSDIMGKIAEAEKANNPHKIEEYIIELQKTLQDLTTAYQEHLKNLPTQDTPSSHRGRMDDQAKEEPCVEDIPDARLKEIKINLKQEGIVLNPCLSERAIASFEEKHSISLPPAYRNYLLYIGNGGDGPPDHGIARLGEVADDMSSAQKNNWISLKNIRNDFPFTRDWIWEDDEVSDEGTMDQINFGNLYIGNEGCGMYWHLVVSGPDRGTIWQFTGEGIIPTSPKMDFLEWIESRLND